MNKLYFKTVSHPSLANFDYSRKRAGSNGIIVITSSLSDNAQALTRTSSGVRTSRDSPNTMIDERLDVLCGRALGALDIAKRITGEA